MILLALDVKVSLFCPVEFDAGGDTLEFSEALSIVDDDDVVTFVRDR